MHVYQECGVKRMFDITEYIPRGKDANPKSRWQLECETGLSDRDVRDCINKAKKTYPIINVGGGYYIAEDPDDPNLEIYIRREMHRIKEISKALKRHKALWRTNKNQRTLDI